jgi:hypothetical protein
VIASDPSEESLDDPSTRQDGELSPNLGDGSIRGPDYLGSFGELYTEDEFRQLIVAIEAAPGLLDGLGDLVRA